MDVSPPSNPTHDIHDQGTNDEPETGGDNQRMFAGLGISSIGIVIIKRIDISRLGVLRRRGCNVKDVGRDGRITWIVRNLSVGLV